MDIESNCRKEVVELHEFFQQWFTGELPQTEEALDRFVSVVAEGFHIVSPAGRIKQRDKILDAVRAGYRSSAIKIWIKNHTHRLTIGDVALVTYEEWQTSGDETRGLSALGRGPCASARRCDCGVVRGRTSTRLGATGADV